MVGAETHRYIVALDFGTTFTGIAHVSGTKKTLDDIQVIKNWPGPSKEFTEVWKTPSKVAYRSENGHVRNLKAGSPEVIWGYGVEPGMISYSWMKLLLDGHAKPTEHDDKSVTVAGLSDSQGKGLLQLPAGKTALDVCIDYLSKVYEYTNQELNRTWGEQMMASTPIDFWVTFPATWSDRAKEMTKTAALTAGFASRAGDRIFMITEPEAAAIATLNDYSGKGVADQVQPGDSILVCDCGGGTVDLNTYRILATLPNFQFEELAVGEGGKVGSTFIDRQFHELMCARFGVAFYSLPFQKKGPGNRLMKEFESIKRDFSIANNAQMDFLIPLPMEDVEDSEYYDAGDSSIILSSNDMETLFKPSIAKIKKLLESQIAKASKELGKGKTIDTIILVGGFGDSTYLYEALSGWCAENGNMQLLCSQHPQAAIVKGAALRGLGGVRPLRRLCRRHYGLAITTFFKRNLHPEHLAFVDSWDGRKRCKDVMDWKVEKGSYVTEQTKITATYARTWYAGAEKTHLFTLYASTEDSPPEFKYQHDHEAVGVIHCDLEDLDMSLFETKMINGRRAYKITFEVDIYLGDDQGTLVFKVFSQGEVIGNAALSFDQVDNAIRDFLH